MRPDAPPGESCPASRPRTILNLALFAAYALVVAGALAGHAMWRDEIQAWLIVRDAGSLAGLFHNLRYEGHPALWYLVLTPFAWLGRDPHLMQIPHFAFAAATIALVLWRAPFTRLERILFPFGYFVLFEYAVKSRSYGLGLLLALLVCALWPARRRAQLPIAILLALLANVQIVYTILSAGFLAAAAVDRLAIPPRQNLASRDRAALAIVALGWALAGLTALPPADSSYAGWYLGLYPDRATIALDSPGALFAAEGSAFAAAAGAAFLAFMLVRWRASPPAAALLAVAMPGLVAFFYLKLPGQIWHHGAIYTAFLAAIWIARLTPAPRPLLPGFLFALVLLVQAIAGLRAVWEDRRQPYSSGREVAAYLAAQGWDRAPILATSDASASTIVGYLGIDGMFYARRRAWGSFVIWDLARQAPLDLATALADADRIGAETILSAQPLDPEALRRHGFTETARFLIPSLSGERSIVYHRPPTPQASDIWG